MELKEIQNVPMSFAVTAPFAASWSDDDRISVITEKELYILGADGGRKQRRKCHLNYVEEIVKNTMYWFFLIFLLSVAPMAAGGDITTNVFGSILDVKPAAFGDFNSDELTDLFVVHGSKPTVLEVMLAKDQEPLLRRGGQELTCKFPSMHVSSVVPGNFDGDAKMDVMVALLGEDRHTHIHIMWGGLKYLNCSDEKTPLFKMKSQPVALDYNNDTIVDLFGEDTDGNRMFFVFNESRAVSPIAIPLIGAQKWPLRRPHSHAFLDINRDFAPDLYLSTNNSFEVWLKQEDGFKYDRTILTPENLTDVYIGQSLFVDLELTGHMYHLLPVCYDGFADCRMCSNSTIYAYVDGKWHNLNPDLKGSLNQVWGFYSCGGGAYTDTVTLRAGDFNMDGYPDLLATLNTKSRAEPQVFLLENVESKEKSASLGRTYVVRWDALAAMNNKTVMGAFYDLYQDGILDVILYGQNKVQAFRNTLDYDANFVKVMVLTGTDRGGNLPGPQISYRTTTQEGTPRAAVTTQLPQSAHFSLGLPYIIFGLGRTPNFVDTLTVGIAGKSRDWTQIIPNSQMVVIPSPLAHPNKWRAQLFITPSKMILLSVAALTGTCCLITAIIGGLYWKERREDRIEKLQEAHRFHFDAM